ncbi:6639_t:CDS:2 [Funneliformis caledonium]|uniref:6639_t:CDS:1 n=1 Tax=Funneliformis caledonium TaxID=1117310 RepID=A0A9N9ER54_9GLOM|nr:6639_t:CDS:2 [Funneliformis caledonium]
MVNEVEQPHNNNSNTELEQLNHKKEVRYAVCQVEVIVGKKCEKTYKVGTSTSNCFEHLANIHGITKEQEEANVDSGQSSRPPILTPNPNEENTNIDIETLEDVFILDENQDNPADANNNKKQCQKKINLDEPMQTSGMLKTVKSILYQAMLFYWKEDREISYLPSILDPRIKKLDFAPYEMEWTLYSLKDKYDDMKFNMSLHSPSQSLQSPTPSAPSAPFITTPTPSTLYQSTLFDIFKC